MSEAEEEEGYLNRHAEWALAKALRQYASRSGEQVTAEWIQHCAQSIKYFIDWRFDKPDQPPLSWVAQFVAQHPGILGANVERRDKPEIDRMVDGLFRKLKSIPPANIAYMHISEFEYGIEKDELYCRMVDHDPERRAPLDEGSVERFVVIDGVCGDGTPLKKRVLVGSEEAELGHQFENMAIEQYSPEHSAQFYWVRHFAQETERTSDPFQTRYLIVNQSEVPAHMRCQHILERNLIELIIVPDEIGYFTQVLYALHFDLTVKMLRNTRIGPAEPIADKRIQRRLWLSMFLPGGSQHKLKDAMNQIGLAPYDKVFLMYQALPFSSLENTCVVWTYPLRVLLTLELDRNYVRPNEFNAKFERIREQAIGAFTPFDVDVFDTSVTMLDSRDECIFKTHLLTGELMSPFQADSPEIVPDEPSSSELSALSDDDDFDMDNFGQNFEENVDENIDKNVERGGMINSKVEDTVSVDEIESSHESDVSDVNGIAQASSGESDGSMGSEAESTEMENGKDGLGLATGLIDHIWDSVLANLSKPTPSVEELQRDIPVLHKSFEQVKSIIAQKLRRQKRRHSEPPKARGLNQTSGIRPYRRSLPGKPRRPTRPTRPTRPS